MDLGPAYDRTGKSPLRIGFVALIDCAPLAAAQDLGIFADHGIDVVLLRQPGWASVRDKIVSGELDASQAVCGLPFAISYGLGGARRDCLTALLLNTHGDAITISNALWEAGVRSADDLAASSRSGRWGRALIFGAVHPHSAQHFLLLGWLRSAGIMPGRDVIIVTLPPPLMARSLAAGNLDGFCVGEPWNTVSICAGTGHCLVTSAELCPNHPEKCLIVRREFAERRAAEHARLVAALLDACRWCDDPANTSRLAALLARPGRIGLPEPLLRKSLRGDAILAHDRAGRGLKLHRFSGEAVNRPSAQRASWVLRQMNSCGVGPAAAMRRLPGPSEIFRADIFDAVRGGPCSAGEPEPDMACHAAES